MIIPLGQFPSELHADEISAMKRERQIKNWTRAKKEALIQNDPAALHLLAQRKPRSQA